ncbi:BTB/POZ domain-containing protein 7 isoform X2 [Danaus plexippus]|uniref:BTB/POZ domain-containing protein 7 isoform X2 n=1 Tax=Danaus plexippus TaxID=13037 RepID=UPI002AB03BAB|nr:BTB/POZ domain-containing protein 7 isoform X2 [Danaus plexippus]
MSRLLCCLLVRRPDMGAALSHPQEGEACDAGVPPSPPTMADVIRERKKKAGGAGLGTLRRRLAAATRRPRDSRPDRGCEHARFIRSVVSTWRLSEVFLLREELEAGAALRDLATQAELAREPAPALHADLLELFRERWWCDVELVGKGFALPAHRVILAARCSYFRELLMRYPNSCRVPLEGAGGSLPREELEAAVVAMYAGPAALRSGARCDACCKWERGSEAELDIISVENSTIRRCTCGRGRRMEPSRLRRLADLLGFTPEGLHRDMKYLLDSGELCDARLSWSVEGEGADGDCEGDAEGDGGAYGFRSAMELPCHRLVLAARSRFFRSVMSRRGACSGTVCVDERVLPRRFARALLHAAYTDQVDLSLISKSSSNAASGSGTLRGSRGSLEDAFRLYELARFLEMPIAAQGCEDALVRALCADTLPAIIRWSGAKHASAWVHRQATRYLRDEFPAIMSHSGSGRVPRAALAAALASPFLQASEAQALRAVMRWAERAAPVQTCSEPNIVWHTRRDGRSRRRRRGPADDALREAAAALVPLLRLEHLPPDCDLLQQAVRRGLAVAPGAVGAEAWLAHRPPRCFLPYLDEIKALLEDQEVPEAELARARRQRYAHRIPDTLYMVTSHRARHDPDASSTCSTEGVRACVPSRVMCALRARLNELRAAPPAQRALRLHAADTTPVTRQLALRAVRERSLPDAVAELLLNDDDDREVSAQAAASRSDVDEDCCRSNSGSLRCGSTTTHTSIESRPGTYRRELPARPIETHHRSGSWSGGRLSAVVPDVAMAPNANTHLLTARDYPQIHAPIHTHAHAAPRDNTITLPELGVLQLDLGDGAAHAPRHGSRAQRAAIDARRRETQGDHDELRAAIELSVIRAYSSLQAARRSGANGTDFSTSRPRATPSPSLAVAAGGPRRRERQPPPRPCPPPVGRSPSPRRSPAAYGQRDYRAEGAYSRSPRSRGHSPAYT